MVGAAGAAFVPPERAVFERREPQPQWFVAR